MVEALYVAVYTDEYGSSAIPFVFPLTGENPRPPDDPVKLAELLGLKHFYPDVETIVAVQVSNPSKCSILSQEVKNLITTMPVPTINFVKKD